jgi:hypothetical protein
MSKISILLPGVLLLFFAGLVHAAPIVFDLDGLLTGSTETLAETTTTCPSGAICAFGFLHTTGVNIKLPKPANTVIFPDVVKTPAPPAGPVPIPYPNIGGSLNVTVGDFLTPDGELANVFVDDILDTPDFVSFNIFVASQTGYTLPSLWFIGTDATGQTIEYELLLDPTAAPEPGGLILLLLGLAGFATFHIKRYEKDRQLIQA